jgi:hypothetical protein
MSGLGKTIEAGLILTELLLRRRVQRVLVLTPAGRCVCNGETKCGTESRSPSTSLTATKHMPCAAASAWTPTPGVPSAALLPPTTICDKTMCLNSFWLPVASPDGSPHLPWDMLIVDECHNLMPSAFGEDSDLCQMLRLLAPQFEHRLFLSATPHNGHTRCFSRPA